MSEWSLVVFTVALQLSCGICLATTLGDGVSGNSPAFRTLGISVFPIAAAGLIVSLFHLGRPGPALKTIANLGHSRLSLEILLSVIFVTAAMAYSFLWYKETESGRIVAGITTSAAGIAAVASSFSIYLLPAQPAWNSAWLPLSFLATVLVFMGVSSCTLLEPDDLRLLRILLGLGIVGALALLVSAVWLIANVARRSPDLFTAARLAHGMQIVASGHGIWFGVYICLAVIVPITFAVRLWPGSGPAVFAGPLIRYAVFFATLFGTVVGRALMYALIVP